MWAASLYTDRPDIYGKLIMHAMKLTAPGGLDQLHLAEIEPRAPGFGEIQVDIKATSLNFHDYAVVTGLIPADDGRIPMSDGA